MGANDMIEEAAYSSTLCTVEDVDKHITDRAHTDHAIARWRSAGLTEREVAALLAEDIRADGTRISTALAFAWIALRNNSSGFVTASADVGFDDEGSRIGYMIADGPHVGEFYYQAPDAEVRSPRGAKVVVRFHPGDQFAREVRSLGGSDDR